jgi:hypothetical protein
METIWTRDIRLALAAAALLAMGALSWGLSMSTPKDPSDDPFQSEAPAPDRPDKSQGTSKPPQDFRGSTKKGG